MVEPEQKPQPQEICSMRIMFAVSSDEQAISYKKKINEVLADIPNVRIEFNLSSSPVRQPPPI